MELTPSKKVYTLFLNSRLGFRGLLNTATATNDATWLIDWDALFNRDNYVYKNCFVRVSMDTTSYAGSPNTIAIQGVLIANFGQNFTGKNVSNVVLGQLEPVLTYEYNGVDQYLPTGIIQKLNTLTDALGQQIDMPYGLSQLNLQQWRNGYGSNADIQNILIPNAAAYNIMFQFELS